jgi:hypothetical protein
MKCPRESTAVGRLPCKVPHLGWLPAGHRRVGHGKPRPYFKESMTTPCHIPQEEAAKGEFHDQRDNANKYYY